MCTQTTTDRSHFSSYSQTQSFSSTPSSTGHRQNVASNQHYTATSHSQQSSRPQSDRSVTISTATYRSVTSKNGADHTFGFTSAKLHQESGKSGYPRSHEPDRFGNNKNTSCKKETARHESHCISQNSSLSKTQVKSEQSHRGIQKNVLCNAKINDSKHSFSAQSTVKHHSQGQRSKITGGDRETGWSNTEVTNNKASIDLGNYKIDLNKSDSSLLLTNSKTGDKTRIWGDPHIDTNGTSAMFNGSMTFNLPDRTKITVGTQAQGCVTYADKVTITRGNSAYVVNGLSQRDSNSLTVERSRNGRQLDHQTPDGFSLVANRSGTGWINMLTGLAPTEADFKKA